MKTEAQFERKKNDKTKMNYLEYLPKGVKNSWVS